MLSVEYAKRVKTEILHCYDLLEKATLKHKNSMICLDMEIEENKELGNDVSANTHAIDYRDECKARVDELNAHITYLKNMLIEQGVA